MANSKWINSFDTETEYNAYLEGGEASFPNVAYVREGGVLKYQKSNPNAPWYNADVVGEPVYAGIGDSAELIGYVAVPAEVTGDGFARVIGTRRSEFKYISKVGYNNIPYSYDSKLYNGKEITNQFYNLSNFSESNFPLLDYCYEYTTKGTSKGDWYVPSIAELLSFKEVSVEGIKVDSGYVTSITSRNSSNKSSYYTGNSTPSYLREQNAENESLMVFPFLQVTH